MEITNLLQQMLILMIFLAVGFIAGETGIIDSEGNRKLTKLLLHVAQPALIIDAAIGSKLSFSPADILRMLGLGCLMYAVLIALGYGASPLFRTDAARKNTYRFQCIFSNSGFMGFPVVSAMFGSDAVLIASIFNIPFNFLAYSIGVLMLSGGRRRGMSWRVLLTPTMIATVLGIVLIFTRPALPYVITEAADRLGGMTVPGSMLVIGATLSAAPVKSVFGDGYTYLLCLVRLILSPLAVWAVCGLFVKDAVLLGILTVLSAMPAAAISTMLSIEYGGDPDTASRGVFLTTLLSAATAPLMAYLLLM